MSSSIKFTRMLPLQHGIITNRDDMEPDIDFHEKIDALNDKILMVDVDQKDSFVSDEVQMQRGFPGLAKIEVTDATLPQEEIACLRDESCTRHSTTSLMVSMAQKDSCIGDKAQIKCIVPHQPSPPRFRHTKPSRPPPTVYWMNTQTFREMLKTWPAHVEYPSDMENITSAQYNCARLQWPTGVPMIETF